ncbi:MAG: hypothetical protein ACPGTG_02325 [Flavobacteriales bacterium]
MIFISLYYDVKRPKKVLTIPNVLPKEEGYLFIKDSKGKKDRKTILSDHLVD